jgi:outer membrane protein
MTGDIDARCRTPLDSGLRKFSVLLAICQVPLLFGCSNPLASRPEDRGQRVDPERLRAIGRLPIEEYQAPPRPEVPPEQAARSRFVGLPEVSLSIEEVRAAALENNLDLRVALVNPEIAAEQVKEEDARFEPVFTTRALWQETDSPTATTLEGAQQRLQLVEPGVRIPLRTGGIASVSLPVTRSETNNIFSTLNPAYTSDLEFSISHPLLRNAGRDAATIGIQIAGYNEQVAQAQTKLQVIQQLAAAERAYWLLYEAREDLRVAQLQYELANTQLERAQRLVNAGEAAEIETVRAQSGVAQRLEAIIRAQNLVLTRQRELKRIINAPGLEVSSTAVVIPATPPRPVEYLLDAPALVERAIAGRMEILETELRLLSDSANIRFARNQTLPQLDLDATYRINGLGRSERESFRVLRDNNYEDWSIGARMEVPLGNEFAQSRLRQALLARVQRLSTLESRKLLIMQEVLDAADRIQAGWERILATRQAAVLAGRSLQAEQRQFDVGGNTSTDVLDAAARLAEAQLAEIRAVTDYQLAQVDLAQATGLLLEEARVRWRE